MPREYEQSNASIVMLGNFNPSIFSPAWFGRYGLLTEEQVAAAVVTVIHPEVTIFTADWVEIRVEKERFQATTSVSPIQIRDLALKTFVDYLGHTPIHSLGINRHAHCKLPSAEHRMRLGRAMAPLGPWADWGKEIETADKAEKERVEKAKNAEKAKKADTSEAAETVDKPAALGGMVSLTMHQPRTDRPKGYIQITVQPSASIPRNLGVFFQVNDHYELVSRESLTGCEEIMELLDGNFEKSLARADRILDQVLTEAEK